MALTLYFVDAIVFKATNFDVDAVLVQNVFNNFKFSDVHLQDVLHLEEGPRLDFTVDAHTISRPDNNYDVDGLLQEDGKTLDFSVDANAQIMPSENYSVDAFLQQETDLDFTADAIIVDRNSLFWDADTIISSRLPLEFTIDPITIGSLDREFDVDSYLQELDKITDFTIDSILDIRIAMRVDGFVIALNQEVTPAVDAILILRKDLDFQVDGTLQKDGFLPFNLDSFILKETDDDSLVDAQVVDAVGDIDVCTVHFCTPKQPAVFFTVDAITPNSVLFQWNVDANIEGQGTGILPFTVDAFVTLGIPLDFTVDANLVRLSQFNACPSLIRQTLNCVSLIRRRGTS